MAVRKETVKLQFNAALPAVLEPGEQVQGGVYCVSGPNPLWAQGLLGLAGYFIFGMRYYYAALTDRRVLFINASFWTGRPGGLAWSDPRDSITISDLQTDNKLWNWCRYSSPTKENLRLNFHAFWRPETKALGDQLADRIVGPRLGPGAAGDATPGPIDAPRPPPAATPPSPPSEMPPAP